MPDFTLLHGGLGRMHRRARGIVTGDHNIISPTRKGCLGLETRVCCMLRVLCGSQSVWIIESLL